MECPQRDPHYPYAEAMAGPDEWRNDGTCSFCGSLHPDKFMELVESGVGVTPTDKSYKVYLNHGPHGLAKFYFEHLSVEQRKRFVDLYNQRNIAVEFPGHFYVLPFFMGIQKGGQS